MISYLEFVKQFFRLEGVLGAKIYWQIDLTFSVLIIAIVLKVLEFPVSPRVFHEVIRLNWQPWLITLLRSCFLAVRLAGDEVERLN